MYSQISGHSSEGGDSPSHDTTKSLVGMVEASLLLRLTDEETPLDSISVQVLGLSARANNALGRSNIESILELANCTESDLLSIRNIGLTTLEEIRNKTNHYIKNMLSSIENTDITRMSLLTYLEARGIEVTQSRSTVSDTQNDTIMLNAIPLRDMPLPGDLVNELLSSGLDSSLDLWVLAFGHYIQVHSKFFYLLQKFSKDIIGQWTIQEEGTFEALVKINSQLLASDTTRIPDTSFANDSLDNKQLRITLSIGVSESSRIFWEAILPFPCFLQDLILDIKDDITKGFCIYFLDIARFGTVKHWSIPHTYNWHNLSQIRPGDTFLNWICSIKKSKAQRDFDIFKEWFGLMSGEKKTLEEVGKKYNISRERVRQIVSRFLQSLLHPSRRKWLAPFISHFDNLFRRYGCIMTLKEVVSNSRFFDDFGGFSPLNAAALILNSCHSISALDYSFVKDRSNVFEIGWVTWYLNNEIDPENIREIRKIAMDLVTDSPYKYNFDELIEVVSTISGVPNEVAEASLRTCRELQRDTLGVKIKSFEESVLTIVQMAVIALREIMVAAHHTVIFKKMQELFPGRNLNANTVYNTLSGPLFRWVDRGTYGLAEWGLPKIEPKQNYTASKNAVAVVLRKIGRPAYVSEISKYLDAMKQEYPNFRPLSLTITILYNNPHLFVSFGSGKWGLTEWDIHPST